MNERQPSPHIPPVTSSPQDEAPINWDENDRLRLAADTAYRDGRLTPEQLLSIQQTLTGARSNENNTNPFLLLEPEDGEGDKKEDERAVSQTETPTAPKRRKKISTRVGSILLAGMLLAGSGIIYRHAQENVIPEWNGADTQHEPSKQMYEDLSTLTLVMMQNLNTQNDPQFWSDLNKLSRTTAPYLRTHVSSTHQEKSAWPVRVNGQVIETYTDIFSLRLPGNSIEGAEDVAVNIDVNKRTGQIERESIRFYVDRNGKLMRNHDWHRNTDIFTQDSLPALARKILSAQGQRIDGMTKEGPSNISGTQEVLLTPTKSAVYNYILWTDGSVSITVDYISR